MKKLLLIIFTSFAISSCTEEIKFNSPAFEGQKDSVFWRALSSSATINSDGELTITARTYAEKIELKTNSTAPNIYDLGIDNANTATYIRTVDSGSTADSGDITFTTGLDVGNGKIVITEYDAVNKTISGTFKFSAENVDGNLLAEAILNFQYGVFYKVPVK